MSLTVKAYLLREPVDANEIRRFAVDHDVSSNYTYLRQKIAQIFPNLQNKAFSLYWKDAEDELIAFSSDVEQTEALGFVSDGIFKVYIKEDGDNPEPEEDNEAPHPHVFCDGCEGPVCGVRYKCTVCPDYDLCSKCKDKGIHSEHNMMAILKPRVGGWMGFNCHFGGPPHHFGGGPPPPHFGGPPPPPPPPHHFGGPPHQGGHHHGGPWHGFAHGHHPFAAQDGTQRRCPFRGQGHCGGGARFWASASQDGSTNKADDEKNKETKTPGSDGGEQQPTGEEYLKNIGQHVAAMLDPFGIDVDVDIEHGGIRQRCDGNGPHGPFAWASWGGHGHCGAYSDTQQQASGDPSPAKDDGQEKSSEVEKSQAKDVEMETGGAATAEDAQTEHDTETGETGTASKSDNGEDSASKDWTLIDDGDNSNESTKNAASGVSETETQTEKETSSTNGEDRIARALDHMKMMGFTDEGGWLTTLLQATGGDINKALDAIRANRGK